MKKIIIVTIILVMILIYIKRSNKVVNKNDISNNSISESNNKINNSVKIDENYIEKLPQNSKQFSNLLNDNKTILTEKQINQYNEEIKNKADMIYDIDNIQSITKEDIKKYINDYSLPKLPKFDNELVLTKENTKNILENRNISNIESKEKIVKGIIVKRANLKSFPTDIKFFDSKEENNFDRIQQTELHVNTPVLIIHESKDKQWNFVITNFYVGWVNKENIAIANDEEYEYFIKNDNFGIITDSMININDTILDMSVKLPYLGTSSDGYKFALPQKDDNGFLIKNEITISIDKAHIGYLPYSKRNVCIQAFKYEGVNYSWGGMDQGVDCSSFVGNIYRTFGFMFPRNTSSQNKSVGKITLLKNKTSKEKIDIIKDLYPALLYQQGHVMLYLGQIGEKNYIIHASSKEMKVTLTELSEDSNYIKAIDRIVYIN